MRANWKLEQTHHGITSHVCKVDFDLFEVLQTWVGLCEMAKVCNVPIFYLYTQGQQIKVYSQVYKKCMYENRVVERDGYVPKDDEFYTGAYVHNNYNPDTIKQ